MTTKPERTFHVYILAGKSGVLDTGMTSNLSRRVWEHKQRKPPSFTQKYNVTKLVWFESHSAAISAIAREKQIKAWRRSKRVDLIQAKNPAWLDLSKKLT
jgi:putative endonuclease